MAEILELLVENGANRNATPFVSSVWLLSVTNWCGFLRNMKFLRKAQNGKASATCKDWEQAHLGNRNGCGDTDPSTSEIYSDSTATVESIARDDRRSDGTSEHVNASPKDTNVNPDSETTCKKC